MMTTVLLTIVAILLVGALILLAILISNNSQSRRDLSAQSASIMLLQNQIETIKGSQEKSTEALEKNLQSGQKDISQYVRSSQETLNKLHKQLGELKGSSDQMVNLGTDVRKLQDILKSPKLRGQLGERSLENLLSEILPANSFRLQYTFKNGKIVDALVQLPDFNVPIDAKFPLPSFEQLNSADTDDERTKLRRQFQRDVTKHIDKIADNYILPVEGTLDFALMYIPAENVYYETIINLPADKTDLLKYALDKKVIPVSPNLLYAYLMTIVMGLHGLKIEKQAANIRQNLKQLTTGFDD
ncbi:MAG: DNA recombination protein RmuC, partial [Phycisphaerae bacterium]|nr:DNA recombination protein RmuC [Phycisphaerae bacterium]